jgi:hypothetical protein
MLFWSCVEDIETDLLYFSTRIGGPWERKADGGFSDDLWMEEKIHRSHITWPVLYSGSAVIFSFSRLERTSPISIDSGWRRGTNGVGWRQSYSALFFILFFYFAIVAVGCVSDVYADWREPLSLVSFGHLQAKDSLYTQGSCGVKSLPEWHHKSVGCKP